MTIQEATFLLLNKLRSAHSQDEAGEITDWVMEHITGSKKAERMIYKNSSITDSEETILSQYIERLMRHEPVQYILGYTWFAGMKFKVNRNVLIPRPETEELVDWIVKETNVQRQMPNIQFSIIDVGTGSGCIAISLKKKIPEASVNAIDVCSEAINTATENAVDLNVEIDFTLLDFLDEEKWRDLGNFDIIVSNPPYVKQSEADQMQKRVTEYEPLKALFVPDHDALLFYRKLSDFAKSHLNKHGKIFVEVNESLGNETVVVFNQSGFKTEIRKDMQGKDRMVKAILTPEF